MFVELQKRTIETLCMQNNVFFGQVGMMCRQVLNDFHATRAKNTRKPSLEKYYSSLCLDFLQVYAECCRLREAIVFGLIFKLVEAFG